MEGNIGEDAAEDAEAMADKLRPSIVKQIEAQMVYKKQANTSRVSAEFPNLSLAEVKPLTACPCSTLVSSAVSSRLSTLMSLDVCRSGPLLETSSMMQPQMGPSAWR